MPFTYSPAPGTAAAGARLQSAGCCGTAHQSESWALPGLPASASALPTRAGPWPQPDLCF